MIVMVMRQVNMSRVQQSPNARLFLRAVPVDILAAVMVVVVVVMVILMMTVARACRAAAA